MNNQHTRTNGPRVTPEQIERHISRAHQLRSEAIAMSAVRLFTFTRTHVRRLFKLLANAVRSRGSVRVIESGSQPVEHK